MTLAVLRTLWHLLRDFHTRMYRLVGYIAIYELLKLVPAAVLAFVIDSVITFDAARLPFILFLLVILFVASMIVSALDIHIAYQSSMIDFESGASLLRQVAEKLLRLPIGYHEQYNTGRTVHTLHRGVDRLGELIFFTGREVLPTLVQLRS